MPVLFQSTHSLRSATLAHSGHRKRAVFQSTHSLRSATTADRLAQMVCDVSIHALLAECDILLHIRLGWPLQSFNPRTPCGVRLFLFPCTRTPTQFQSTHSLRSATLFFHARHHHHRSFNPRTPCGVRLSSLKESSKKSRVSIHALLAECDLFCGQACAVSDGFNPRTPCGVRPAIGQSGNRAIGFQSTHSLRSATNPGCRMTNCYLVSIHALLAECDIQRGTNPATINRFNPRTPCGVRPYS